MTSPSAMTTGDVTATDRPTHAVPAVFHDLHAIRRPAARVIRMDGGQVAAKGTAEEILCELEAVS